MRYFVSFTTSILIYFAYNSLATTLPESLELEPTKKLTPGLIDPELLKWFKEFAQAESPLELKYEEFNQVLKFHDNTTAAFLRLRFANTANKGIPEALALAKKELEELVVNSDNKQGAHPLFSYLAEEIIESSKADKRTIDVATNAMLKFGADSCPRKEIFLDELNDGFDKNRLRDDFLARKLEEVLIFNSPSFRKEALEAYLDILPQGKQSSLRDRLKVAVAQFPNLIEDNLWLQDDDDEFVNQSAEPFKSFYSAKKSAKKRRCRTAKLNLEKGFSKSNFADHFDLSKQTAELVDNCFRRKGVKSRRRFWRQMEKPMESAFGFPGRELARRKLGLLYWYRDEFKEARDIFISLIKEAKEKKFQSLEAAAVYTMARIEENKGDLKSSLVYYQRYGDQFPDSKHYIEAEIALVLLNGLLGNVDGAIDSADKIIDTQMQLSVDRRSTASLAFALFWSGRLNYIKGNKQLAAEMWRRVATEFYSTFYGALGHFLLEKIEGRFLAMAPTRTTKFSRRAFFSPFDKKDKAVIRRVESLLRLGLKDEASCELSELQIPGLEKEKILAKSMMQYASGDWLVAIKNYGNLPRSFRHGLPAGFERLLFPRAYEESVYSYAKRLDLDPDLIFAIIRQESVFNPKARSSGWGKGIDAANAWNCTSRS